MLRLEMVCCYRHGPPPSQDDACAVAGIASAIGAACFFECLAFIFLLTLDSGSAVPTAAAMLGCAICCSGGALFYYVFGWLPSVCPPYFSCCARLGRGCCRFWCCRYRFTEERREDEEDGEALVEVDDAH